MSMSLGLYFVKTGLFRLIDFVFLIDKKIWESIGNYFPGKLRLWLDVNRKVRILLNIFLLVTPLVILRNILRKKIISRENINPSDKKIQGEEKGGVDLSQNVEKEVKAVLEDLVLLIENTVATGLQTPVKDESNGDGQDEDSPFLSCSTSGSQHSGMLLRSCSNSILVSPRRIGDVSEGSGLMSLSPRRSNALQVQIEGAKESGSPPREPDPAESRRRCLLQATYRTISEAGQGIANARAASGRIAPIIRRR